MPTLEIQPTDAALRDYRRELDDLLAQGVSNEGGLRRPFANLLARTARKRGWTFADEQSIRSTRSDRLIRVDGMLRNEHRLPRGYWESKDSTDDLQAEIRRKRDDGYPFNNILFEDTQRAILYQNRQQVTSADLRRPAQLARLLTRFYNHEHPQFDDFEEAVARFADEIPQFAAALLHKIRRAHAQGGAFPAAFSDFMALCRRALNPNISTPAVEEMLVQHILTGRVLRKVFAAEDFLQRNVIAAEVEKVIAALTERHFNLAEFLGPLDRFYLAIERAAGQLVDFRDKQAFLDNVYERFFQGYSVRVADTHGIVYTPQAVVDFMCAAVQQALQRGFGLRLGDPGVHVLDPCTGTGNFVVHLLQRVHHDNPRQLDAFYRRRLFANEVLLMPYYIASLNIEREFHQRSGRYAPFAGLGFVDTLDLGEGQMVAMFSEANSARVARQQQAPVNVIIGNPPYNSRQVNENDNNKNRKYAKVDGRIRETWAKDSQARNLNTLYDGYIRFFRWAADRLGERDGLVCFVSNNNFVEAVTFDGFRKHLLQDFDQIWHLDLAGNIRKARGEGENVFGDRSGVGIGITLALRRGGAREGRPPGRLHYHRVADDLTTAAKRELLATAAADPRGPLEALPWRVLRPDAQGTWLHPPHAQEFARFLPLGTKEAKAARGRAALAVETVFKTYSLGIITSRDAVVYDFDRRRLAPRVQEFIEDYNAEVDRYIRHGKPKNVDDFVKYDRLKWSRNLKRILKSGRYAEFDEAKIRRSLYRPFTQKLLFFDRILNHDVCLFPRIFPTSESEQENMMVLVPGVGNNGFNLLITNKIVDLKVAATVNGGTQCFPLYTYDADGGSRRDNITDHALQSFNEKYPPPIFRPGGEQPGHLPDGGGQHETLPRPHHRQHPGPAPDRRFAVLPPAHLQRGRHGAPAEHHRPRPDALPPTLLHNAQQGG